MIWIRLLELHLCFSLQADEAEYSEDQPNQHYDQVNDPHGVLLLLGENRHDRSQGPPFWQASQITPTGKLDRSSCLRDV